MRLGGKQRLITWIVQIESSEQEDAAQRIIRGCNALVGGTSSGCFDFISGLDQWRAAQLRIAQRTSRVRRSGLPIGAFFEFATAAIVLHIFDSGGTWCALCVVGAAIAFAWLLWNVLPSVTWHG
jgi:hypothetical protein